MAVMMTMLIRTEGKRCGILVGLWGGVLLSSLLLASLVSCWMRQDFFFFARCWLEACFWLWLMFVSGVRREPMRRRRHRK